MYNLFFVLVDRDTDGRFSLGGCFPFGGWEKCHGTISSVLKMLATQIFASSSVPKAVDYCLFDVRGRPLRNDARAPDVPFPGVVVALPAAADIDVIAEPVVKAVVNMTAQSHEQFQEFLLKAYVENDWPAFPLVYPVSSDLSRTLCGTFQRQAQWTWQCLGQMRGLGGHLGEESLTDLNLLEIRARHRTEIVTKTFTKIREGVEGADWEWWLTGPSGQWLGFRVQAKVLDPRTDRFEQLHYIGPSGVPQNLLLCERAMRASPRCIPLYCLYSHYAGEDGALPKSEHHSSERIESFGCALVDAFFIRDNETHDTFEQLFPVMTPWHVLVCGATATSMDLPHRAKDVWARQIQHSDHLSSDSVGFVAEPPIYVTRLLQNELREHPDPSVSSLTVFRETENPE